MVPPSNERSRRCGAPTTSAACSGSSRRTCRARICRASQAAYEYSAKAHEGQQRRSGDAYITHPVAVAEILAGLHLDSGSIKAALLHDVLEDTSSTLADIESRFGKDVALLVDGVSKIDHLRFDSAAEAQAESFRKMLLAMAKDLRVILVKLADRTHNMRTIQSLPLEKQRRIARETLDVYAPIANRLGVYTLKVELEDLGFKTFYPFRYRVLQRSLRRAKGNQRQLLRKIEGKLTKGLAEAKIPARVLAREKHLYSIYLKMQRKQAHLSDIVDVYGVRVIVPDVDSCYRALGVTHQLFKPMPGRFKDYISIPRVNGYQSLHTTLFGPSGMPLEVQLRTEEMDKVAERGVAAHWSYKAVDKHTYSTEERAREWLSGLMEMERAANSEEFLETVKADLFPDKVYVFTPKGDIMRLPRGATAVDFAYAVHTDIGNRCVAAKIDRRLVPLKTMLHNGETVEIVTARGARPNPNWVNFVSTAKARNAIRGYLKNLKRDEAQELGRRLLNQELMPYSLSLRKLPTRAARGAARRARSQGRRGAVRAGGLGRAARAGHRGHARAADRGHRIARGLAQAARDRGHRRHGRELCALLLSDPRRRDHRLHVERPRHRDPPRQLPQSRGVPQAAREVDSGELDEGRQGRVRLPRSRSARSTVSACSPRSRAGSPQRTRTSSTCASTPKATRRRSTFRAEGPRPPPARAGGSQHPLDTGRRARDAQHRLDFQSTRTK